MDIRENTKNTDNNRKMHLHDSIDFKSDKRLKRIYERYHTGRPIILDDLRYLWIKDPEACEKLTRNILTASNGNELEKESYNLVNTINLTEENENTLELQNSSDYTSSQERAFDPSLMIRGIMETVKLMAEKMSETEQKNLFYNFNKVFELKKLVQQMKYWDDTFVDKVTKYSYEDEKKFDRFV